MDLSAMFIPIVFVGLALTALVVIVTFARNYVKCAPNEVLVVYGRKKKDKVSGAEMGYRLITGGATFVWPIFESYERIALDTFQVPFNIEDSPNVDGVPVSVEALANLKVSSKPDLLANAVERLLELGNNPQLLQQASRAILEGQLRMIVGTLKIEDIIKDREKIAGSVLDVAKTELNKLGLEVDIFVIQRISDKHGYIEALGKKATAEVKKEASIGEAEAMRDSTIKTAEADRAGRVAAAIAKREAETAEAEAAQAISDAQRARDEQIAQNDAIVKAKQARIEIAAQTAAAEEDKKLRTAKVEAERAEVIARTALQAEEKKRNDAHLEATVIVQANRDKEAMLIAADAEQEAAVMRGEALRIQAEKKGLGEKAYNENAAEGRKKAAEALRAEKEAEAAGQKALLLAQAEGTEAQGLADGKAIAAKGEAEGRAVEAKLLAEAEGRKQLELAIALGIEKKNAAMAELSPDAMRILLAELLPAILVKYGEAGEKVMGAAMEPMGQAMSAIDSIHIMDFGGGNHNGDGSSILSKLSNAPVETLTKLTAGLKAAGFDVEPLLKMAGIDMTGLTKMFGKVLTTETATEESAAA